MSGTLFVHVISKFILFVSCLEALERVCNKCSQITFNDGQAIQDRVLVDGRKLKTMIVKSDTECFVECSTDCRCMSFSVCGKSCHLNAGSQHLVRNSLGLKHGCHYYDFPAFEGTCDSLTSPPKLCCLQSSPLCFNGGTCVVNVTDTTKRFKCQCPNGYYGNQCQIQNPKTCMDYWTDEIKPLSGEYDIVDSLGLSYGVFCDFDSEVDMAWTLFQSFDMTHDIQLNEKSLAEDFPLNVSHLNWQLFRLPKSVMTDISTHSTYWRATCSYPVYGVDFKDYIRVRLSIMNPLSFTGYFHTDKNICLPVDYFDIMGTNCKGCTQIFFQGTGSALHLKPWYSRVKKNCTFPSSSVEYRCTGDIGYYPVLLGLYSKNCVDPIVRCTENANSTTEFWFGVERKSLD